MYNIKKRPDYQKDSLDVCIENLYLMRISSVSRRLDCVLYCSVAIESICVLSSSKASSIGAIRAAYCTLFFQFLSVETASANTFSISCANTHKSGCQLSFHVNEYQLIARIFSNALSIFVIDDLNLTSDSLYIPQALIVPSTSRGYAGVGVLIHTNQLETFNVVP
jgi:hypothetical protein